MEASERESERKRETETELAKGEGGKGGRDRGIEREGRGERERERERETQITWRFTGFSIALLIIWLTLKSPIGGIISRVVCPAVISCYQVP